MKMSNCLKGSAWSAWQLQGAAWRVENPGGDQTDMGMAAAAFANQPGWPSVAYWARLRAFLEGAKSCAEKENK